MEKNVYSCSWKDGLSGQEVLQNSIYSDLIETSLLNIISPHVVLNLLLPYIDNSVLSVLLFQGTSGMKQCPEERNSLIYDVMFSEFHQKRSPYVTGKVNVLSAWTNELILLYNISYINNFFSQKKFTLAQCEEIEKQKRKLEEEKEEFKRQTDAAMKKKIQEKEQQRLAMEAEMATKMQQTEEERREMFSRIQELEAKMKEMKTTQTPVVRNAMKCYQKRTCKISRKYKVTCQYYF